MLHLLAFPFLTLINTDKLAFCLPGTGLRYEKEQNLCHRPCEQRGQRGAGAVWADAPHPYKEADATRAFFKNRDVDFCLGQRVHCTA